LDIMVTHAETGAAWTLTDLLGRPMGRVAETATNRFMIEPAGHALETMAGLERGPHPSLDAALAQIETHTRGVCRRGPDTDPA
jgi:hypothetical protein